MRFALLGSGSQGNGLLVQHATTTLLLDCGFGLNETVRRLQRLGVDAACVDGIVVTHEHDDHIGGVARLARKFDLPVWLTPGTLRGFEALFRDVRLSFFEAYAPLCIGDIEVRPFPVPHDAREPAQFVFGDGQDALGVLTDTGCITPAIVQALADCSALVLECNHDGDLLANGDYPFSLKQRIAGRFGHLDNASAAALLQQVSRDRLRHVVAAHLSESNNRPELAQRALAGALGCSEDWIGVADQDHGMDWRQLR